MYACKPPHFPLCNEALQKGPIHRGIYWYIMNHLCCIPSSKSFFHILHPTRKQQRKITDEKKQRKLQAALGREQSFELCTHTHAHSEPLVGSTYTHTHNEPLVGSTRASYVSRGLTSPNRMDRTEIDTPDSANRLHLLLQNEGSFPQSSLPPFTAQGEREDVTSGRYHSRFSVLDPPLVFLPHQSSLFPSFLGP